MNARRRDRRVYLRSHPVLFGLLAAARRRAVLRVGRTVVVSGEAAYREALTRLPLDRLAEGTTGAAARELASEGLLFDQTGSEHRQARRALAVDVAALRPVWLEVLERRIAAGRDVEVVELAAELAGATTAAMLDLDAEPLALAAAARQAAAGAVRAHLPGRRRRPVAPGPLPAMVGGGALPAMLAVAAVNTTVAGLPRAVAWCADAGLWDVAADDARRPALVAELLRVTAPSPLLPRAAAEDGEVGGFRVRRGDRLLLVARHAAAAHRDDPDPARCDERRARLVFGAGAHACPGADLARAQLDDTLRLLAPHRPRVVSATPDRHAALPGWARLVVRAAR